MRTILLTFSPNMTLINEAMRFHHTFNNLGWVPPRDPSTNNFLHSSSLSSHLTCLPTSLSNENLLGACCTFEQCRLNVLFMFKKKKSQRKASMSMKRGCKQFLWKQRHQMLLMIKRETAGWQWSMQLPASQRIARAAGKASACATSPSELWKTITYLNQGYIRGALSQM